MSWQPCLLGDVITLKRGHDLPESQRLYGAVPVVSSSGITGYHNEPKAKAPGVVTGRYGTLGEVFYLEQDFWPLNTALYVVDFKGSNPRYVAYLLKYLLRNQQSDKAAVPGVNRNVLHTLKVLSPDRATQERIADLLSQYDDLIENNRRRIKLLQESARLLYREWFVYLRYPGHEHVKIVDGVPKGWERKKLADICASIDYGYTASARAEEVGPKLLRITDIVPSFINWASVPHCNIAEDRRDRYRLSEGDIVIARTGATVGYAKRLHKRHPDAVFASYLVRLRITSDVDNLMVGVFVESDIYKNYVQSRVGGAAQPNANAIILSGAAILIPPFSLQRVYRESVEPLFDQREILLLQNEKLQSARDLLLPRLMNGEIKV